MDEQDDGALSQAADVAQVGETAGSAPEQRPPSIDIEALAERVYALMLDDLRLAGMRGAPEPGERWNR